jgi:hypothetical protein
VRCEVEADLLGFVQREEPDTDSMDEDAGRVQHVLLADPRGGFSLRSSFLVHANDALQVTRGGDRGGLAVSEVEAERVVVGDSVEVCQLELDDVCLFKRRS